MDRRRFLQSLSALGGTALLPRRAPATIAPEHARPRTEWGVQSGDVTAEGAVVWSRTDRPAHMHVQWALDPGFKSAVRGPVRAVTAATDFTGKVPLTGLPSGRDIFYRVAFVDQATRAYGPPLLGRFRTPDLLGRQPVSFAWSGDTCGQGYGINPDMGGMIIHERIRAENPDVFIHCGDLIYADQPLRASKGSHGRVWHNLITPEKSKVAETLAEFRGNYRYNLLDEPMRGLCAEVPWIVNWDDHETKNNWWPGRVLDEDRRYTLEKRCDVLAARGRQAFLEYTPLATGKAAPERIYRQLSLGPHLDVFVLDARTFRGPNSRGDQKVESAETRVYGEAQLAWFNHALTTSKATWKLVVNNAPLGLLVAHDRYAYETIANGGGPPRGRELELVRILKAQRAAQAHNVVWITADVHYAAAHRYDPERAIYKDFDPFWEFVAGPINAASLGPNRKDPTFGITEVFCGLPPGTKPGLSPLAGFQFYGVGRIDPVSRALTVSLHNLAGKRLWATTLPWLGPQAPR